LSFKINLPTKKAGTFSLWGIGGLSSSDEKYAPESAEYFEDGYIDYTKTGMYAAGISHTIFAGRKSYIQTVISSSTSYSSQNFEEMDTEGQYYGSFFDDLQNNAIRFSSYFNRKVSSKLSFRTGVKLNHLNFKYYSRDLVESTQIWDTFLNSDGQTNLYQAYAQGKYKFSDNVIMTAGLNYVHFTLSNDNSVEPRLGLVVGLPNEQKLGFGYGKHSKHENLPVYLVESELPDGSIHMPNSSLQLSRAHHFVASYEKLIGKELLFKAEAYYQHIDNLPVANNPDKYWSPIFGGVDPNDTLENIGKGRNYGLEFTLQKSFSNNYYFLVTSSIFDSKYKPADSKWYNTKYNVNFINNFVGGKEIKWSDNKMVGLNAKLIWSGGKRQTPIDLEASIEEGETVLEEDKPFSVQTKDYLRLDLGVRLHFYKKKSEHVLSLDIQNVTNRLNTWYQTYDDENKSVIDYPMAGLIPIISYRIEF
jgi:outer membrane receptor protein involved in Fe transport